MAWARRGAIGLAVLVLAGYGAICGYMYGRQDALVYPGGTTNVERLPAPETVGLADFRAIGLDAPDGAHLVAWWHAPADGRGVVLYLHGNAQNLAAPWRVTRLRALADAGLGVLGLEYRGFGGSSGSPSEPGLIGDAETAYDFIRREAPASRIALFGDSLGAAVAVALATRREVAGLVLDSPFASAVRLGELRYPWLPVSLLMKDTWRSDARMAAVAAPVMIGACDEDRTVPPTEARRLFDLAAAAHPEDKFFGLNNCGHVEIWKSEPVRTAALQLFSDWTRTP